MTDEIGGHTVVVRHRTPGGKDADGYPLDDVITDVPVEGAFMQPASTVENRDGRNQVVDQWKVFAPAGTVFASTDEVLWKGRTFQVHGKPAEWSDDEGTEHHVEVPLREVTG